MSKQQKAIYEQRLYQLQNSMKRMKEPKENDIVDGVNKAFKEFENIINQVNKMNSVENGPSLADSKSLPTLILLVKKQGNIINNK